MQPLQETVIESRQGKVLPYLREFWASRELFFFLAWKQVKVRYATTTLGFGWMVLSPLMHLTVLSLIFGYIARLPSDGVPYPAFVLTGLLPWRYFVGSVGKAAGGLAGNTALMRKVYVPRLYLPLIPLAAGFADFLVTLIITLLLLNLRWDFPIRPELALLPIPLAVIVITVAGAGLWLSVLTVQFEDLGQIVGNVLQVLMFATPVIWPMSMMVSRFGAGIADWYVFYPMAGVLEAFRHILLGLGSGMPWSMLAGGFATGAMLLVTGFMYFRAHERKVADLV